MQALEFSYSTSSASIVVASSAMGQDPYTLQIYNGDGIIIEQLEVSARSRMVQESAKEIPKTVIFKSPLFDEIRELHGLAYRQALNVDQMLDTIVQELEQGE
ncbi:hypothetical protein ACIBQX_10405 [Nonomuraea sp. NPDC049714]|uniref:hypothetical protein n=1 Tax=Nonomuraea sp. NPDC049714 TaxID=3364357 RepID=UPI0037ACB6B0